MVDTNVISYITISTTGNATDFGDLTVARAQIAAGVTDGTRGVWGGGDSSGGRKNEMDYITIDTTGNATDFGNLTTATGAPTGNSNDTRGIFSGGQID